MTNCDACGSPNAKSIGIVVCRNCGAALPLSHMSTQESITSDPLPKTETRRSAASDRTTVSAAPDPERARNLMAEHDLTWREAWKLSGMVFADDNVIRVRRESLRPWRIAAGVSGGLLLATLVPLEWMWRSTAGDEIARSTFGMLALLLVPPLLGSFVLVEISLIGLGIKTGTRLERILSWSGAALLMIWFGWLLT
jgi:uncharacterized Zn finger protein (UPF0148 family)